MMKIIELSKTLKHVPLSTFLRSSQRKALTPPCLQTPVSIIRLRYLTSCPASRLPDLSKIDMTFWKRPTRVAQRLGRRAASCPEDPETKRLCSHSEIWPCACREREPPGEQLIPDFPNLLLLDLRLNLT